MKELEEWLNGFITYTNNKITEMKRVVPGHRNIKVFEGEVSMAKKVLIKMRELKDK